TVQITNSKLAKSAHQYFVPIGSKNKAKKSPAANKRYHFIGVGGVGTSALAQVLMKEEAIVTGSDMQRSALTERLSQDGARVAIGHSADNLPEKLDGIIISAAVKDDNPELQAARQKKIMVYKYAQMLGLVLDRYKGIAIAGTHGKSTTCGWLVFVLKKLGINPNFVIGADILQLGTSSGIGDNDIFVAEACEYDRSFLNLHPKIGAILNIESDHLDYYSDIDQIVDAFADFADNISPDGILVASARDPNTAKIIAAAADRKEIITFGLGPGPTISAQNIKYSSGFTQFDCYRYNEMLATAKIKLPGEHNVKNAIAVLACASALGLEAKDVIDQLGSFEGMDRRLMKKGEINDVVILDDYAHHPTEIKASLEAVRQIYGDRRIYCVFQPHQYSRTRFLLNDFADSFKLADMTIVPDIYFVRDTQQSKNEVNSQMLVDAIKTRGSRALFIDSFEKICVFLKSNVKSGDVLISMGAGNIWKVADEYIQWLGKNS
ncbi:MAG: UDP-N-acetylmuramate--L-alanine ligase, partial [Sedimentisphaerales bacterium]|nr:UDP-N-acetylmuramate--L-alanine ligase [Sedimentisphaerales bacterium]